MAFVRAAVGAVVLVLVFLGGLWVGVGAGGGTSPAPVTPGPSPSPPPSVTTGDITYQVLASRCGILAVQGDHADWLADGQYCRVRMRMSSADRYVHPFAAADQVVVTADGQRIAANLNAMQIQDQPTRTEARPLAVLEFDLWFDIPEDATAVAVELHGQDDTAGARVDLMPE